MAEGPGVAADPVDPVDPLKAGGAADPLRAAGPAVARPAVEVAGRGVRLAPGVVAGPAVAQVLCSRSEEGGAGGRWCMLACDAPKGARMAMFWMEVMRTLTANGWCCTRAGGYPILI